MIQAKIYQCQTTVKNTFSHYRPVLFSFFSFLVLGCFFSSSSVRKVFHARIFQRHLDRSEDKEHAGDVDKN